MYFKTANLSSPPQASGDEDDVEDAEVPESHVTLDIAAKTGSRSKIIPPKPQFRKVHANLLLCCLFFETFSLI